MAIFDETLSDGLGVASTLEQLRRTAFPLVEESLISSESLLVQRLIPVLETQTVGIASELLERLGVVVREQIVLTAEGAAIHKQQVYLADVLRLADRLISVHPAELADGIGIATSFAAAQSVLLAEQLQLTETLIGAGRYNLVLAQAIRLADGLYQFFGAEVDEGMTFAVDLLARKLTSGVMTDEIGIADALTPQLLISAVVVDDIEIDDTQIVNMLFNPTMLEGVEINAGFLAPDGSLTTWVMNTRTGAVSEYQNYEFNSFAKIGNRYVGASADGLYELLGDTDDGGSIIARVKGGYMQFGGTRLSRLSAAYIAATGEGAIVLKIITKEGAEYVYQVDTRNGRSTKVHMGKGQRSRYFAFELTTAGQDFDIDTLEFVPVVVQRRV